MCDEEAYKSVVYNFCAGYKTAYRWFDNKKIRYVQKSFF